MAEIKHLSDNNFDAEVLKAETPVLVDFWAPWCGPCQSVAPIVESLADKFDDKLKVCRLNTDENPQTPGNYNIYGIPTLIIFKNGKEVERIVGLMPEAVLTQKIQPHLN
ncbi:thioredoxin [candidate division WOR-3 bacterium JGI_Cruoil_03_51_56]|uniref:Thioredoxin n=1 Tax=candidate division WOR-3 bacterium JGI_Cruoil_03_51_56 TaxID=1973747 RepID=A0A235BNP1_UNCW3|nr:MAG: thioredoxin [candidate division WOR-3 bacterium JGI_Cruoil_03_51_56]